MALLADRSSLINLCEGVQPLQQAVIVSRLHSWKLFPQIICVFIMTSTASQRVVCPPEKFVAAASSDILQELQCRCMQDCLCHIQGRLCTDSKPLRRLLGTSAHCTHASLLFEEDGALADSFPDNTADLQELFKLLEGTSHVEHQSVSR